MVIAHQGRLVDTHDIRVHHLLRIAKVCVEQSISANSGGQKTWREVRQPFGDHQHYLAGHLVRGSEAQKLHHIADNA